jgi:ribonuclease D
MQAAELKTSLVTKLGLPSSITKDEVNHLPLARFTGVVHLIRKNDQVDQALESLLKETVLGVDTETRPSFRRGQNFMPSLLQAATDRAVYLFQLNHLDADRVLEPIFATSRLVKAGIAFTHDVNQLQRVAPFTPTNVVDLSLVARKAGIVTTGLRSLTGMFLGTRVSKGAQVSDWSQPHLSEVQIQYAATDAWITRELYFRFAQLGLLPTHE